MTEFISNKHWKFACCCSIYRMVSAKERKNTTVYIQLLRIASHSKLVCLAHTQTQHASNPDKFLFTNHVVLFFSSEFNSVFYVADNTCISNAGAKFAAFSCCENRRKEISKIKVIKDLKFSGVKFAISNFVCEFQECFHFLFDSFD